MDSTKIKQVIKLLVFGLVLTGLVYTVWSGLSKISSSELSLSSFRWHWLPIASLFYFSSMLICCFYWHQVLLGLGQKPKPKDSFRAFILGQLGKYFPGKALVVLLRTSLISGPQVQPAVAATSVFLETLTYMAVGAGVASLMMVLFIDVDPWLVFLGLGAIVMAGLPIFPPVFRLIIRILRIDQLSPKIGAAVEKMDTALSIKGWLLLPFSWLLVGLSLWSTIQLLGIVDLPVTELPRLTACAGLAIVAGFLSLMPGGLGVREFVLIAILTPIDPAFNTSITMIVAVVLRLVWLMTEVVSTIILKVIGWGKPSNSAAEFSADQPRGSSDPAPDQG